MRQEDGHMAWTGPDMPDGVPRLASNAPPPSAQQALDARVTVVEEVLCSLQRYLQPKEPANFAHRLDMVEAHMVALRALLRLPPPDAPDSDGHQRPGFDSWQAVARTVANLSVKCSNLERKVKLQGEEIGRLLYAKAPVAGLGPVDPCMVHSHEMQPGGLMVSGCLACAAVEICFEEKGRSAARAQQLAGQYPRTGTPPLDLQQLQGAGTPMGMSVDQFHRMCAGDNRGNGVALNSVVHPQNLPSK